MFRYSISLNTSPSHIIIGMNLSHHLIDASLSTWPASKIFPSRGSSRFSKLKTPVHDYIGRLLQPIFFYHKGDCLHKKA